MTARRTIAFLSVLAFMAIAGSAAASADNVQVTPIGRLPFPERGYVIDLPAGAQVAPGAVVVHENGRSVPNVDVSALGSAGIHFGAVLAIDASDSMTGDPLGAAVGAARTFASHGAAGQEVGVVVFNGSVHVLQRPTDKPGAVLHALASAPRTEYGTKIYDGLDRSLTLLQEARVSTGSIVLLSDGADIGSTKTLAQVAAAARANHVRIFTVGLRSSAFRAGPLQQLATQTGGTYSETTSPKQLAAIYAALGQRLASEYVVRYRSQAAPQSQVDVTFSIRSVGSATMNYTAPTPAGLAPFHRPLVDRFLLSGAAPVIVALLVALLIATMVALLLRPRENSVVSRVHDFTGGHAMGSLMHDASQVLPGIRRNVEQSRWLASLERDLEIARVDMSARRLAWLTIGGTLLTVVVLVIVSPILGVLGLLAPLLTRAFVQRKLREVRDTFADQLPPNLQVLASSLRVGHSFIAALSVVVDNANEPSHSELNRIIVDERIGMPIEDAIRKVAVRMESRDLEQVALLAELQRTAGGNAAEVLDTVVETLRERADVRRLVRTLTAQGRMARWILSSLPPVAGLVFLVVDPTAVMPLLTSGIGQIGLVVAAFLVVTGSLVIQKIINIKV